jgi:hypothetical protein
MGICESTEDRSGDEVQGDDGSLRLGAGGSEDDPSIPLAIAIQLQEPKMVDGKLSKSPVGQLLGSLPSTTHARSLHGLCAAGLVVESASTVGLNQH